MLKKTLTRLDRDFKKSKKLNSNFKNKTITQKAFSLILAQIKIPKKPKLISKYLSLIKY